MRLYRLLSSQGDILAIAKYKDFAYRIASEYHPYIKIDTVDIDDQLYDNYFTQHS